MRSLRLIDVILIAAALIVGLIVALDMAKMRYEVDHAYALLQEATERPCVDVK